MTAPADNLLQRLDKVRPMGPGKWLACCPAHDDRSPSLSIRETDDGRLLVNCFASCPADDVVAAVGLTLADLYPASPRAPGPGLAAWKRRRLLDAIEAERLVLLVARADLKAGQELCPADAERVELARSRIQKMRGMLA